MAKKLFILAILIFGGIIFVLPFLDMVFTSVKSDDEIAQDKYHFLPKRPLAKSASPYVAEDVDNRIERPADMKEDVWKGVEGPYTEAIRAAVTAWWDNGGTLKAKFAGADKEKEVAAATEANFKAVVWPEDKDAPVTDEMKKDEREKIQKEMERLWDGAVFFKAKIAGVDRSKAIEAMTQTVGAAVLKRMSDVSRAAGVAAMVKEAGQLANDATIFPEFKLDVPRFALGEVRVRTADFSNRLTGRGEAWSVVSGPATLSMSGGQFDAGAQLNYDFAAGKDEALVLRMTPPAAPGSKDTLDFPTAKGINRVSVSFLPDRSWAKVELFVIRGGVRYQMKEPLNSDDVRWTEVELRWPDPEKDSLSGRSYRLLEPLGEFKGDSETPFAVEMKLTPVGAVGAIYAKASRNYTLAFMQAPLWRYIMTSFALAILNIVLVVFASSFAAYAFARIDFPGRDFLFAILLATMMIPGQVTMIPSFLIYKHLGMYNTLLPLWIPSVFGTAFFIFMARQFLKAIPKELEEAARIDGCGFFRIYFYIMLPLIRPTLAAIAMFAFQGAWNNFMGPLIYVNDERLFPLAFGLWKFNLQSGASNSLMMAGAFVMTLPLIITFFLFQRYFVQGIALSGLGGR